MSPDGRITRRSLGVGGYLMEVPRLARGVPSSDPLSTGEASFTSLESPAIYGEDDIDVNFILYRKVRVKAPSFLTGFTKDLYG